MWFYVFVFVVSVKGVCVCVWFFTERKMTCTKDDSLYWYLIEPFLIIFGCACALVAICACMSDSDTGLSYRKSYTIIDVHTQVGSDRVIHICEKKKKWQTEREREWVWKRGVNEKQRYRVMAHRHRIDLLSWWRIAFGLYIFAPYHRWVQFSCELQALQHCPPPTVH